MNKFFIILTSFLIFTTACGQIKHVISGNTIDMELVDSVELVQVNHPYLGGHIWSKKLDNKLIPDFLSDFGNKKEDKFIKFYSCYVIKIYLKDTTLISYRTNGIMYEKLQDKNTLGVLFHSDTDSNIISKYWGITKDQFCKSIEHDTLLLKCTQQTKDISYQDSIKIKVKKDFDKMICFQISLEKNINNVWTTYSSNVLNEPFSKAPEICVINNVEQVFSFKINTPELFEKTPNGSITSVKGNSYKIGLFRLKINYGFTSDNLSKFIYLPEFKISEPRR